METLIAAALAAIAAVFAVLALLAVRRLQKQVEQLAATVSRLDAKQDADDHVRAVNARRRRLTPGEPI